MVDVFRPFRRRRPAGWRLIDPRPIMADHPYTFFVPTADQITALRRGDLAKMMFEAAAQMGAPVERMWVIFDGRDDRGCFGRLDNDPCAIEGLAAGDEVRFQEFHITSLWEARLPDPEGEALEARMFTRARVDRTVLNGSARIGRAERLGPCNVEGIDAPDSGWHIYGDGAPRSSREALQFVAIGVAMNRDDALLPHLDAPVGTVLTRGPDGALRPG